MNLWYCCPVCTPLIALREQSRSDVCYCQFGKGRLHGKLAIQTIGDPEHAVCHAQVKATFSTFGTLIGILIVFMQRCRHEQESPWESRDRRRPDAARHLSPNLSCTLTLFHALR